MADPGGQSAAEQAGRRAARNTTVRAAGEVVGKLATFVLFAALARGVGQEGVGSFVFAFAFLQVAMIPIALGCDTYLLREIARDRTARDRLVWNVVALKLGLAGPVIAISIVAVSLLGYDPRTRETVYVLAAGLLLDLLSKTLHSVFNATERSDLLVATLILQRVSTAALGLAALAAGYGVVTVAGVYAVGALLGLVLGVVLLQRTSGLPRLVVSPREWRALVTTSAPFAVQDIFGVLLFRIDAVILSLMAAEAAVGRYGSAYRLLESTLFISWALNGAFMAMYAYLGRDTEPTVGAVFQRSIKAALVLLVPCAVILGVLAEPVTKLAYGADFADAADPLRVLSPVVVMLGLVTLGSSLIISRRSARTMVPITAAMLAVNVVLNLLLIPSLEDDGAAAAMLATEAVFTMVVMTLAAREVGGINWLSTTAAPGAAGAAMGLVMLPLLGLPIVAGAAGLLVYAAAFVLVERRVSPADLRFLTDLVRRRRKPSGLAA